VFIGLSLYAGSVCTPGMLFYANSWAGNISSIGPDLGPPNKLDVNRFYYKYASSSGSEFVSHEVSLAAHVTLVRRVGYSHLQLLRPVVARWPQTPPRRLSKRSSRVVWTTATYCCTALALATAYFAACSLYKTLQRSWWRAPIGVTMPHHCCGDCTGSQSDSESSLRSWGWFISHWLEWHQCT